MRRLLVRVTLLALVAGVVFLALGYRNATSDPIVRRANVAVADWPAGAPPFTVLALSDIHVIGPDMPPQRVEQLVEQFNALEADLVVVAGDLMSERHLATQHYGAEAVARSLAGLRAKQGVLVAPGNHDHWFGLEEVHQALAEEGIEMISNSAVERGPLRVALIDDEFTGHADVAATFAALEKLAPERPIIVVTHSPDEIPALPRPVAAVFSGHTHCGQIALPLLGRPAYMSRYGERFACGDIRDDGQRIFVTAGLGASLLPLRYGAPSDVWLVTFGPAK